MGGVASVVNTGRPLPPHHYPSHYLLFYCPPLSAPAPPTMRRAAAPEWPERGGCESACVWQCEHAHAVRVCCMWCVCWGELWGMWMGHGGVVTCPPHPHHGNLHHALVGLGGGSYGKCCGGVRACVSDAAACCGVRRCSASLPAVCGALQHRICAHQHLTP